VSGYAQPKAASKFDLKDHGQEYLGKLMLIWPTRVLHDVPSSQGVADTVVECDIAIIDKIDPMTGKPEYLEDVRLWWSVLINQTKSEIGGKVLGRLGQGANTKGNPPWLLLDYTEQDVQWAEQYEAAFPRNAPTQPSAAAGQPPQAAAPQAAWNAPAPAPAAAAPAAPGPETWPPGLADFLKSKQVDLAGMTEATARQIAATYQ
jgi:hypothetical protein